MPCFMSYSLCHVGDSGARVKSWGHSKLSIIIFSTLRAIFLGWVRILDLLKLLMTWDNQWLGTNLEFKALTYNLGRPKSYVTFCTSASPAGHGAPKATEHSGGPGIAWGWPWIRSATSPTHRPIHSRYPVFTCYKGVCRVLGGMLQPSRDAWHLSVCHSLAQQPDGIT